MHQIDAEYYKQAIIYFFVNLLLLLQGKEFCIIPIFTG